MPASNGEPAERFKTILPVRSSFISLQTYGNWLAVYAVQECNNLCADTLSASSISFGLDSLL